MRRQRRVNISGDIDTDSYEVASMPYTPFNRKLEDGKDFMELERLSASHRFESTIEAKVDEGDTLQALALRFHCTVTDIKRLNKIDKDNEIYARKIIKIPVTPHSVLLETLPIVHRSGSNSPAQSEHNSLETNIMRNPLEDAKVMLGEKLIVASVNSSGKSNADSTNANSSLWNSKLSSKNKIYTDQEPNSSTDSTALLDDLLDDDFADPQVRPIRGPALSALHWSGSDGDMTWVCLFIVILALCFAIPLIIVIFWAHPHTSGNNNMTSTAN
ncbi:lysM and putative peptidoglycan-binding domain-containing protein 4 [Ceratitis capitata]|uniref:(Mediterranean fruit fly) hypothetical protein n=1 Tax=Ceratitis capitata TaxID=7213 RepID=A0A811VFL0_CERCA|nr:lysM and putative peptidoglycan-binding domain-containing protein 4 [Ceratitis capitata]CAD7014645.1 unnamed protein product [Ceratitis capitata]